MTKKILDEKYSYQIDEHDVVHLFRGEDDCQQFLTNPLISAIFKIEQLEKENAELKGEADSVLNNWCKGDDPCPHLKKRDDQLTKAKELLKQWLSLFGFKVEKLSKDTEQFLSEVEK